MDSRKDQPIQDSSGQRWGLIDAILTRLIRLIAYLGISPTQLMDRLAHVIAQIKTPLSPPEPIGEGRTHVAIHAVPEIMRTWFREIEFLDASGQPRPLPVTGPRPNFTQLVKRSAPGVDPSIALKEMLAGSGVKMSDVGIVPVNYAVLTTGAGRRAEHNLYLIEYLLTTALTNTESSPQIGLYQREVLCTKFDRKQLPRLQRYLEQQGMAHMVQLDDWLHNHEVRPRAPSEDAVSVVFVSFLSVKDAHETIPGMHLSF